MDKRQKRDVFLATCLLESIEDENYRNTKKLLIEHHADPNLLIPGNNIAPIHYAAGMENTTFAEAAMKLILKCNGNPNVQTVDGETPLHIAVIWNRSLIVKMLLDHGADITITDAENNTPINHAITEKHFDLLPIFQNYAFEKKLQKDTPSKPKRSGSSDKTPKRKVSDLCKRLKQLDLPKTPDANTLTPNQTNYNFRSASPFLIDVKYRKPVNKKLETILNQVPMRSPKEKPTNNQRWIVEENEVIEISSESEDEVVIRKNLFELTEGNLEKHLLMTPNKNRISLVGAWRDKVNKLRQRKSFLPIDEFELDSFIRSHAGEPETATVFSKSDSVSTVRPKIVMRKSNLEIIKDQETRDKQVSPNSETNETFFTAEQNALVSVEKDLGIECKQNMAAMSDKHPSESEIIFQTQEKYQHVDVENDVVFYEHRLLAKPVKVASSKYSEIDGNSQIEAINRTCESASCTDFALPTDYDTDDLRRELKFYGDVPGPITKSTKRLYLKRLVRYKRRPQTTANNAHRAKMTNFSVELLKTMRDNVESLDFINEYATLERLMAESFQTSKKFREGNLKTSFIYLLIDPRKLDNFLAEITFISMNEAWRRFIHAIFYVGKGKSSRPYAHLYDAIKLYNDNQRSVCLATKFRESLKLEHIIDIWRSGKGVICLPVFHNITPAEAYTREAAIIDCLGVENLTNLKRGDYYGVTKTWTTRERKKLGVLLLYKAMHVFMVEGESQLRPDDIKKH